MKHILILNGSPRKAGNTSCLVQAFAEGAESAGHEVTEVFLAGMHIRPCRGCWSVTCWNTTVEKAAGRPAQTDSFPLPVGQGAGRCGEDGCLLSERVGSGAFSFPVSSPDGKLLSRVLALRNARMFGYFR